MILCSKSRVISRGPAQTFNLIYLPVFSIPIRLALNVLEDEGLYFGYTEMDDFLASIRSKESGSNPAYLELEYHVVGGVEEDGEAPTEDEAAGGEEEETDLGGDELTATGEEESTSEDTEEAESEEEEATSEKKEVKYDILKIALCISNIILFLVVIILLIYIFLRERRRKEDTNQSKSGEAKLK